MNLVPVTCQSAWNTALSITPHDLPSGRFHPIAEKQPATVSTEHITVCVAYESLQFKLNV